MFLAALVPASVTARSAAHLVLAASSRCLLVQGFTRSRTSSTQRLASNGHLKPAGQSSIIVSASSAMPSAVAAAEATQPRHGVVTAAALPADDSESDGAWRQLGAPAEEVQLRFTLPTGQSFRWRATGADEYTGVVGQRVFKLRQEADDVSYTVLARGEGAHPAGDAEALRDYFNLGTQLAPLAVGWAAADKRFRDVQPYIAGARVLRQDPLECAFEFICSSNNHISRIHGMVETLCRTYGTRLHATHPAAVAGEGATPGLEFYAFPTLQQLGEATEAHLRASGFGYRAKFITGSVAQLAAKPGGDAAWLLGLRDVPYPEAAAALCTLPGIGPKVAACVCLFSLDKAGAIPVDTHVWQLACRYYAPHLRNKTLNKQVMEAVETAFVERFGPYAGWAHNTLFIAELASQQEHLPEHLRAGGSRKPTRKRKQTAQAVAAAAGAEAATPAAAGTAAAAAQLEAAAAGARAGTAEADLTAAAEQPMTPARGAGGGAPRVKLEHTAATTQDSSGAALGAEVAVNTASVTPKAPGGAAAAAAQAATPAAKQQQKQVEDGPSAAAPDTPAQQAVRRRTKARQARRTA